jgi:starch phosphorylase
VGWAIGQGEEYTDADYQDRVESDALYNLLEKEVVPLFYDRDASDVPRGWVARMKTSMKRLTPIFNTNRMVAEYAERFYIPASSRHLRLRENNAARVLPLVDWRRRLRDHGGEVRVVQVDRQPVPEVFVGTTFKVTARVFLGGLSPKDVRVQIYHGAVDSEGRIAHGQAEEMTHVGTKEADHLYESELECRDSGSRGFAVRVAAFHEDAILPYEQPWLVWQE